ncbi:unnamed protein product [Amoebophrya sp. A25]|nr:unnamed protein product [Amoebophrya sp. A25]|eukprot:GSA25T00007915001.1
MRASQVGAAAGASIPPGAMGSTATGDDMEHDLAMALKRSLQPGGARKSSAPIGAFGRMSLAPGMNGGTQQGLHDVMAAGDEIWSRGERLQPGEFSKMTERAVQQKFTTTATNMMFQRDYYAKRAENAAADHVQPPMRPLPNHPARTNPFIAPDDFPLSSDPQLAQLPRKAATLTKGMAQIVLVLQQLGYQLPDNKLPAFIEKELASFLGESTTVTERNEKDEFELHAELQAHQEYGSDPRGNPFSDAFWARLQRDTASRMKTDDPATALSKLKLIFGQNQKAMKANKAQKKRDEQLTKDVLRSGAGTGEGLGALLGSQGKMGSRRGVFDGGIGSDTLKDQPVFRTARERAQIGKWARREHAKVYLRTWRIEMGITSVLQDRFVVCKQLMRAETRYARLCKEEKRQLFLMRKMREHSTNGGGHRVLASGFGGDAAFDEALFFDKRGRGGNGGSSGYGHRNIEEREAFSILATGLRLADKTSQKTELTEEMAKLRQRDAELIEAFIDLEMRTRQAYRMGLAVMMPSSGGSQSSTKFKYMTMQEEEQCSITLSAVTKKKRLLTMLLDLMDELRRVRREYFDRQKYLIEHAGVQGAARQIGIDDWDDILDIAGGTAAASQLLAQPHSLTATLHKFLRLQNRNHNRLQLPGVGNSAAPSWLAERERTQLIKELEEDPIGRMLLAPVPHDKVALQGEQQSLVRLRRELIEFETGQLEDTGEVTQLITVIEDKLHHIDHRLGYLRVKSEKTAGMGPDSRVVWTPYGMAPAEQGEDLDAEERRLQQRLAELQGVRQATTLQRGKNIVEARPDQTEARRNLRQALVETGKDTGEVKYGRDGRKLLGDRMHLRKYKLRLRGMDSDESVSSAESDPVLTSENDPYVDTVKNKEGVELEGKTEVEGRKEQLSKENYRLLFPSTSTTLKNPVVRTNERMKEWSVDHTTIKRKKIIDFFTIHIDIINSTRRLISNYSTFN